MAAFVCEDPQKILGLADDLSDPGIRHTAQWKPLLLRWLTLDGFLSDDDMNGGHENAV